MALEKTMGEFARHCFACSSINIILLLSSDLISLIRVEFAPSGYLGIRRRLSVLCPDHRDTHGLPTELAIHTTEQTVGGHKHAVEAVNGNGTFVTSAKRTLQSKSHSVILIT